jgi:hypothetical protein
MDRSGSTFARFLALVKKAQLDIEPPRLALEMTLEELSRFKSARARSTKQTTLLFEVPPAGFEPALRP